MPDACRDQVAHREVAHVVTRGHDLADAAVAGVEGIPRVTLPVGARIEATVEHDALGAAGHERVAGTDEHLRGPDFGNVELLERDDAALGEDDARPGEGTQGSAPIS
jgi:hypothetical protein